MKKHHKPSNYALDDAAARISFSGSAVVDSYGRRPKLGSRIFEASVETPSETASEDSCILKGKSMSLNAGGRVVALDYGFCSKDLSKEEKRHLRKRLKVELYQLRSLSQKLEARVWQLNGLAQSAASQECHAGGGLSRQINLGAPDLIQEITGRGSKEKRETRANQTDVTSGKDRSRHGEKSKPKAGPDLKRISQGSLDLREPKRQRMDIYQSTDKGELLEQCPAILKRLMTHKHAWVFNEPVDVKGLGLHDYFKIIQKPMDLGTIKKKLESATYLSPMEFAEDVRLTFSNAMTYNPQGHDVHVMAKILRKIFENKWKIVEEKLKGLGLMGERDALGVRRPQLAQPSVQLVRRVSQVHSADAEPSAVRKAKPGLPIRESKTKADSFSNRQMTFEEKRTLSRNLENLPMDKLEQIVQIIRDKNPNLAQTEDEIEVDIDSFDSQTLWELHRFVMDFNEDYGKSKMSAEKTLEMDFTGANKAQLSCGDSKTPEANQRVLIDKDGGIAMQNSSTRGPHSGSASSSSDSDSGNSSGSNSDADVVQSTRAFSNVSPADKNVPQPPPQEQDELMVIGNASSSALEVDGGKGFMSDLDEEKFSMKVPITDSDSQLEGEQSVPEQEVYSERRLRAALLRNRFADTILKAQEKTLPLTKTDRVDPEKCRKEREDLEKRLREEKLRLQAEARVAESAQQKAEAEAAAEARRKREAEREAARLALQNMEKTVVIYEHSEVLKDLEMLRSAAPDYIPSSGDETSPVHSPDGLSAFPLEGVNPLEQLGLFMKDDEEEQEQEVEPLVSQVDNLDESAGDEDEEGEIED